MAGQMDGPCVEGANLENLVIVEELIEDALEFLCGYHILWAEGLLHFHNALSDGHGRSVALFPGNLILKIRRGADVICMSVCLEDYNDLIFADFDKLEYCVSSPSGNGSSRSIIIQHGIDDGCARGCRVGYNVLPRAGAGLKNRVDACFSGGHAPSAVPGSPLGYGPR